VKRRAVTPNLSLKPTRVKQAPALLGNVGARRLAQSRYPLQPRMVMKELLLTMNGWVMLLCLLCSAPRAAGQFVDLRAQIEFYDWSTTPAKVVNVHCVVGTNSWEMDGDFCSNCDPTYWCTGKRIIEHSITTKTLPNDSKNLGAPVGAEIERVAESVDGNPGTLSACGPNGEQRNIGPDYLCSWARVVWLAYCSGPCLKRPGRLIFPPSDLWKDLICAPSGFSDRTEVFDDVLGLPKSVNLYTHRRLNRCFSIELSARRTFWGGIFLWSST
jgi:hypothetical protein